MLHIRPCGSQIPVMPDAVNTPLDAADQTHPDQPLSRAVILAVAAASLAVAAFAITTQSYWIDEAMSLIVAMAPDPSNAWRYAQAVGEPAMQTPLYHVYLFLWHKVFGGGEWAMRASNLPWFVLGQLAFLLFLRHKPKLALTACLLSAVSPAIWTNLDEARPYIMEYAAACWLVAAIVRSTGTQPAIAADPQRDSRLVLTATSIAILVLVASGLSSLVWAAGFAAALVWLKKSVRVPDGAEPASPRARPLAGMLLFCIFLAILAAYYVLTWTGIPSGASGPKAFVQGLIYVAYELLGFSGFGPGKLDLRVAPLASMMRRLPVMLPLAACLAVVGFVALREIAAKLRDRRTMIAWLLALALPGGFLFVFALLFGLRPAPREFQPVLPALIVALSATILCSIRHRSPFLRVAAVALPVLWLGSSLNLRWQQAYAKDDYRTAARIAAAALRDNKEVWWAADAATAFIYLTPISMEKVPGRVWAMQGPEWNDLRFKLPPRVIVISKPDIYDAGGAVSRYAAENHFAPAVKLQAITVFTRPSDPLPPATR